MKLTVDQAERFLLGKWKRIVKDHRLVEDDRRTKVYRTPTPNRVEVLLKKEDKPRRRMRR